MAAAQLTERVSLANFKNMAMSEPNGALVKTSGGDFVYNATATSADFIAGGDSKRRGVSCRVPQNFTTGWKIGLVSAPSGQQQQQQQQQDAIAERVDCGCLTYAVCVGGDRGFYVYEGGNQCGRFGSVQVGDYIEIVLNSEKPPSIEYRVNCKLQYKRKTPIAFPLFPKICAIKQGTLAEDLRWIVDPAVELQAHIAELEIQLRKREEEKQDLRTSTEAKQAQIESLQAAVEEQKKEILLRNEDVLSVRKENAELLMQLKAERDASQAGAKEKEQLEQASRAATDEKLELQAQIESLQAVVEQHLLLQTQLEAERDASQAAAKEKERLQQAASRAATDEKLKLQALVEQLQKDLKAENEARLAVTKVMAELQMQLEAEREASRAAAEKEAGIEALHSAFEQLKKEMKAECEALLAVTKEKAELQVQAEREASRAAAEKKVQLEAEEAASCAWADEKLKLEIGALRLSRQSQTFEKAIGELADENARFQVEKKQMHAEMQELRRLVWSDEARSEAWDFVGSSPAPSSVGGNAV